MTPYSMASTLQIGAVDYGGPTSLHGDPATTWMQADGDYHIRAHSAARDVAEWMSGYDL